MADAFFRSARARIRGNDENPRLSGTAEFLQTEDGVLVTVRVRGLPPGGSGFFALHIHSGDGCEGEGFPQTGGHFDPGGMPHPEHAGDLPPLLDCGGQAYMRVLTDRFFVRDVIGRTIVIHGMRDDFTSQPAGNAGGKIACGVIVPARRAGI